MRWAVRGHAVLRALITSCARFFTTCIALSYRRLRVVSVCVVVDSLICVGWYVSWDGRVASSVAWPRGRASDCAFGANRQALAVSFAFRITAYYYQIIINAALRIGTQVFGTDAGTTRVPVKNIMNYVETASLA